MTIGKRAFVVKWILWLDGSSNMSEMDRGIRSVAYVLNQERAMAGPGEPIRTAKGLELDSSSVAATKGSEGMN